MAGWGNFSGRVNRGPQRIPDGVPAPYVMQPFTVKLEYHHRSFATVDVEVGYDELAATEESPERRLSEEVSDLFAALGLAEPQPVAVELAVAWLNTRYIPQLVAADLRERH